MAADAVTPILPSATPNAGTPASDGADDGVFAALLGAAVDAPSETPAQPQAAPAPLDSALALQLVSDAPVQTHETATVPTPAAQIIASPTDEQAAPEPPPPAPQAVAQPPVIAQPKVQARKEPQTESDERKPQAADCSTPEASALAIQTLPTPPVKTYAPVDALPTDDSVGDDVVQAAAAKLAGKTAPKSGEMAQPSAETAPETAEPSTNAPRQAADGVKAAATGKHAPTAQTQADGPQSSAPIGADASLAAAQATPRSPVAPASTPVPHNSNLGAAGNTVAQEIVRQFDGGNTSFQVRLDPPELGRVDIKLEVSHDKKVTATIAADNPLTMKELISTSRELQRALSDAGLDLADNGLTFSDQRENAKGAFADAPPRGTASSADDGDIATPPPARPFGIERWGGARVDVWV